MRGPLGPWDRRRGRTYVHYRLRGGLKKAAITVTSISQASVAKDGCNRLEVVDCIDRCIIWSNVESVAEEPVIIEYNRVINSIYLVYVYVIIVIIVCVWFVTTILFRCLLTDNWWWAIRKIFELLAVSLFLALLHFRLYTLLVREMFAGFHPIIFSAVLDTPAISQHRFLLVLEGEHLLPYSLSTSTTVASVGNSSGTGGRVFNTHTITNFAPRFSVGSINGTRSSCTPLFS